MLNCVLHPQGATLVTLRLAAREKLVTSLSTEQVRPENNTATLGLPMRAEATLLMLDKDAVEQLLTPAEVTQAVHEAFVLHGRREGRVFPVVREKLATGGVFGIKSGDVPSQGLLGFKAAGFWPRNREAGGEPHQATILLFDPATGRPQCVIDGNAITTVRTGAAGGLGLALLGVSGDEVLPQSSSLVWPSPKSQ